MGESEAIEEATTVTYDVVAVSIFAVMAFVFLFPCNSIIPLDRRTVAVLGSVVCYTTRAFCFPHKSNLSIIDAVDWDVLLLLSSIMIVNHLVVNQAETKYVITKLRKFIKAKPMEGFWVISLAAFIISPFLTNDGVCLLFVEPLLSVFTAGGGDMTSPSDRKELLEIENSSCDTASRTLATDKADQVPASPGRPENELCSKDAIYFLLTLACSANIGSALTYTGNPQNMIVSGDCIKLLPPGMFLLYQLLPSMVAWVITTGYVYHSWSESVRLRREVALRWEREPEDGQKDAPLSTSRAPPPQTLAGTTSMLVSATAYLTKMIGGAGSGREEEKARLVPAMESKIGPDLPGSELELGLPTDATSTTGAAALASPAARKKAVPSNGHVVVSPIPYLILFLLLVMITMIFVDVMSIACLICVTAMVMIVSLAMGNHWRNQLLMVPSAPDSDSEDEDFSLVDPDSAGDERQGQGHGRPASPSISAEMLTREQRTDNLTHFFDEMFNSVDYSLLLIFLGTFIVVANVESTGLPKRMWSQIVGNVPFRSTGSVIGISLFVLLASQFLGNVAIIQMAKPNISSLDDEDKMYAWVLISFVATVGGNLTITGSAANIIVAEKARRIDPDAPIEFFNHFRVCFLVTIVSCLLGGSIITLMMGPAI